MYYLVTFVYVDCLDRLASRLAEVYSEEGSCETVVLPLLRKQYPSAEYITCIETS